MNNHLNRENEPEVAYQVVPAASGKLWLDEAWGYFRAQGRPIMFAVLLLVFLWASTAIPILGIVMSILSPVFVGGVLLGIRAGFYKSNTRINLFAAWNKVEVRNQLILLGLVLMLIGLGFSGLAGPELTELQMAIVSGDAVLSDFRRVIFITMLSTAVISACSWLAIPEITFRGTPVIKAVMLGLSATMANWRALSMLGLRLMLIWIAAIFLALIISALLLTFLGSTYLLGVIAFLPVIIVWLLALALMFILQYLCWRDILADKNSEQASDLSINQSADSADSETTQVIV